jgi:hypothetical protein
VGRGPNPRFHDNESGGGRRLGASDGRLESPMTPVFQQPARVSASSGSTAPAGPDRGGPGRSAHTSKRRALISAQLSPPAGASPPSGRASPAALRAPARAVPRRRTAPPKLPHRVPSRAPPRSDRLVQSMGQTRPDRPRSAPHRRESSPPNRRNRAMARRCLHYPRFRIPAPEPLSHRDFGGIVLQSSKDRVLRAVVADGSSER